MLYYPVRGTTPKVGLVDAIRNGVAPDSALYLPERLPLIPRAFFNNIAGMTLPEIGYVVANMFFGSDIPSDKLKTIIDKTITFPMAFSETSPGNFTLDLTLGPTRNYNDIGARFMAHLVSLLPGMEKGNIIVATSENVGNAVADAFHDIPGFKTYVVYPAGVLSLTRRNELQAYGDTVIPVEIGATFHECQNLVRDVLLDPEIKSAAPILSANSVNVAILLPRVIFFLYAYARLAALGHPLDKVVIATPTENLGNVAAAIIARKMGLPVSRFIAMVNNDLDASDIINESRIEAMLKDGGEPVEIFSPETHPLQSDEISITMKLDDPEPAVAPRRHPHNHPKSKIVHFGPSLQAMRRLILNNTRNL